MLPTDPATGELGDPQAEEAPDLNQPDPAFTDPALAQDPTLTDPALTEPPPDTDGGEDPLT